MFVGIFCTKYSEIMDIYFHWNLPLKLPKTDTSVYPMHCRFSEVALYIDILSIIPLKKSPVTTIIDKCWIGLFKSRFHISG